MHKPGYGFISLNVGLSQASNIYCNSIAHNSNSSIPANLILLLYDMKLVENPIFGEGHYSSDSLLLSLSISFSHVLSFSFSLQVKEVQK